MMTLIASLPTCRAFLDTDVFGSSPEEGVGAAMSACRITAVFLSLLSSPSLTLGAGSLLLQVCGRKTGFDGRCLTISSTVCGLVGSGLGVGLGVLSDVETRCAIAFGCGALFGLGGALYPLCERSSPEEERLLPP